MRPKSEVRDECHGASIAPSVMAAIPQRETVTGEKEEVSGICVPAPRLLADLKENRTEEAY